MRGRDLWFGTLERLDHADVVERALREKVAAPDFRSAITDFDEALMYVRRGGPGDINRARPLFEAAHRQFENLGMTGWIRPAASASRLRVTVPPNHEPIRGRAAIVDYYRAGRDAFGELQGGTETWRASASGNLVSLVGKFSVYSGRLRITSHGLFERQPDGSLKCTVDMFGFRDPAM